MNSKRISSGLKKAIWVTFFSVALTTLNAQQDYEKGLQNRADLLTEYVAKYYPQFSNGERPPGYSGKLSDFGKYHYPKIIAEFEHFGPQSAEAEKWHEKMDMFKDKPTFHFNLVGLPRILFRYPDAPSVKKYEKTFLAQVFKRNDSYNPWTCEGTENHVNMSRTSGYLYAQLAMEKYPGVFPEAEKRLKQMKRWMGYFSKTIYKTGVGEFNSSIYAPYNIIGWLNVYDFAKDKEVKKMARAVLDYYAVEMALHYSQAMTGGSDLRGKGNVESFQGAAAFMGWLWFGDSPQPFDMEIFMQEDQANNEVIQSVHAATSEYRVPEIAVKLAQNKLKLPAYYRNSKPGYLLEKPSSIKQSFYRTQDYNLGAGYFPYGGWSAGDYQIVSWKLISRVSPGKDKTAQYVSGIGMEDALNKAYGRGNMRSPFDQLVQHKNVLIQLTRVPENAKEIKAQIKEIYQQWKKRWKQDFYKRFPDDTDKKMTVHAQDLNVSENQSSIVIRNQGELDWTEQNAVLFVELEQSYLALRSVRGEQIGGLKNSENEKFKVATVKAPKDKVTGLILEVAGKSEYKSLQAFQKAIAQNTKLKNEKLDTQNQLTYTGLKGDRITCRYQVSGEFFEPIFDWGYGPHEPLVIHTSPPFVQPEWPRGKGHGKIAQRWINGEQLNMKKAWPVYSGPHVLVDNGRLELTHGNEKYVVDYTEEVPVFSDN